MTGETDLAKLLQNMQPKRNPGEYVFCTVESLEQAMALQAVGMFEEKEGITVILPRERADARSLLLIGLQLVLHYIFLNSRKKNLSRSLILFKRKKIYENIYFYFYMNGKNDPLFFY